MVEGLVALQDGCGLNDPPEGESGDKFCRDENLPSELISHYRDLLRAHVIMGSGNLAREAYALAGLLVSADVMARQVMRLHLLVLDELVAGLGNRSTRHVMMRADMLVLEVLAHLAEGYRRRYRERQAPPRQLALPGFEAA